MLMLLPFTERKRDNYCYHKSCRGIFKEREIKERSKEAKKLHRNLGNKIKRDNITMSNRGKSNVAIHL